MSSDKSSGSDGIRIRDLKVINEKICQVLAHFINLSIKYGYYPNELKMAIIRPIFKQGSHFEYTNYRPIAILNTINKITEKIIVGQITKFLEENSILNDVQHGFRPGRSTATVLAQFTDEVNNALNEQKLVLAIFIDFKKAFDTLDHDGLLQAMAECGIRGPMNNWFRAYLQSRCLKVKVCGTESEVGNVKYGVPTGSVYGPVGYIMHVNSMPNVLKQCKAYMYADDTCLLLIGKDYKGMQTTMQNEFNNVIKWAHDNGIIINLDKTKAMLIYSPYSRYKQLTITIKGHTYTCLHNQNQQHCCNNCKHLEVVTTIKYLGLTIDKTFTWNLHIETVCDRLRAIVAKLYTLKCIVSRKIVYVLYHALADAIIEYGLGAYGLTFKTHLNKIKNLQIKLLKLLISRTEKLKLKRDYDKLFKICNILPIKFKVKRAILVEQFESSEHKKEVVFGYPTRKSKKKALTVPRVSNYYGKRTRRYYVPSEVNQLPPELTSGAKHKKQLKKTLTKHYLSLCP